MKLSEILLKRSCPICQSTDPGQVLFEENIDEALINSFTFASRKMPEFMNLKLIVCRTCDSLYAPSVFQPYFLQQAYHTTSYDSDEEAYFAAASYARHLGDILPNLPDKKAALDVGAGNGAFLQSLIDAGFEEVIGIEPSTEAIRFAPSAIRKHIKTGMFNAQEFPKQHFSLICIFQTLEHIDNPGQFFQYAYDLLKPGGVLLMVTHNYRHWLMRLLGKKSPIIDIEHLQLFSPASLQFALKKYGLHNIQIRSLLNVYPLYYWIKLLSIPCSMKNRLFKFLKNGAGSSLGALRIGMKVGNLVTWGYK